MMLPLTAEKAKDDKDEQSAVEGGDTTLPEDNIATPEASNRMRPRSNSSSSRSKFPRRSLRAQRSSRVSQLSGPPVAVLPSKGLSTLITADYQKRLLLVSWKRLQTKNSGRRIEVVMEEVIERLLLRRPEARNPFYNRTALCAFSGRMRRPASIRNHAFFIVDAINHLIDDLIAPPTNRSLRFQHISNIGHNHRFLEPYGFVADMWESFGTAFIDIIATQDAVRDMPGASRLWVIVAASLVDLLRAGFEKAPSSAENGNSSSFEVEAPAVARRSRSHADSLTIQSVGKSPSSPPAPLRRMQSTSPDADRQAETVKKNTRGCFGFERRRQHSLHEKFFSFTLMKKNKK